MLFRGKGLVAIENVGEHILIVHQHPAHPSKMVEAEVVEEDLILRLSQKPGKARSHRRWRITDPNHPEAGMVEQRLGDEPGGVGEVDEPRLRGDRLERPGVAKQDRDRP